MINRGGLVDELNVSRMERIKAVVAGLLLLSVLAMPFEDDFLWPVVVLLGLAAVLNRELLRFMNDNGGPFFALKAFLYHQLYYVYSSAAYAWCLFEYHVLGRKGRLHVP